MADDSSGTDRGREQKEIRTKSPKTCRSHSDVGVSLFVAMGAYVVGPNDLDNSGPIHDHGLRLNQTWIHIDVHYKVWGEIGYQFLYY